ncbi:ketopantoate reductase family protein [Desulfurobacterium atlanticum]|uniref:2-dehydropantoate 2-reductase n=1 Tax=Desulfurobacterium atlanticum TaxID=240169 RepID=A0A238YYW5_9BACT|nr:ketopantoate reductase family protein [Desulfurobacterium atlanticum]SNR76172.1 ketopantoate reductase [Desulfurobacterium atlanticum]
MRYGVVGVGGVGGFYGGMLAKGGFETVFVTKQRYLSVFKDKGLTVESYKHGKFTVKESGKVVFTDSYDVLKDCDVVLLCVKSYDTESVVQELSKVNGDFAVVSVQNGIENEEIIGRYLGDDRVIGATAFIGSYLKEPGVIVHEAAGLLEIGEIDGKISDRIKHIAADMEKAGIDVRISKDINYTLWKKLLWNVAFNPYSVVTGVTVGQMLEFEYTRSILKNLMLECKKVAAAYGISLKDSTIEGYLKSSSDLREYKTSMLLDFERGKPIEIEGITGALIRKAKRKGMKIPYNECVYGTVKFFDLQRKI